MPCYPIRVDENALAHYCQTLNLGSQEEGLDAIARAIGSSPSWQGFQAASLVFRVSPHPALAILGEFSTDELGLIRAQALRLNHICARLRYVSYTQAQLDCEKLAAQLVEHLGHEELRSFRFVGIPRGGLIVLGMLAYVLGLEHARLLSPISADEPLVIVDDCALTGARFGRFARDCPSSTIVYAHLYSHPDLRAAMSQESQIVACLSAHDLSEYPDEYPPGPSSAWREQWRSCIGGRRYWIGQTEHICFPWNEPDRTIYDRTTGEIVESWHVVPPELCLKNRPVAGAKPISVQMQPRATGSLRPSEHIIFGEVGGQIMISHLETEENYALSDVAADMWRAVLEGRTLEDIAIRLAREYGTAESTVHDDLVAFVDDLLTRGVLARH